MANPQTVEVKVDASKLLGSFEDLSEEFIDRLARRVLERIREIEREQGRPR